MKLWTRLAFSTRMNLVGKGLPLGILGISLFLVTTDVVAQATTGRLEGMVTSLREGSPLAGATIKIESLASGITRIVVTDANGHYSIPLLPAGTYNVTVTLQGFIGGRSVVKILNNGVQKQNFRMSLASEACAVVEVVSTAACVDQTNTCSSVSYTRSTLAALPRVRLQSAPSNTEAYNRINDNPFKSARQDPLSTFSIDVDTASYSNVRRFLEQGERPPKDSVRIEELLNYFTYDYPRPEGKRPFSVTTEVATCPWMPGHRLVRVGLQGKNMNLEALPARNMVFLVDVSGSMQDENKLHLIQKGLTRLCDSLRPQDHVAIVVYAGSSGLVLEPTSGAQKEKIKAVLGSLSAGGSTHGSEGIEQAYEVAQKNFQKGADNRVILCTDGDFNVGVSDQGSLIGLIENKRKSGVFLTCLGFGMGNIKDATLEQLADKGNGNYAYIDNLLEMEKVFGEGGGSLVTIAKDVKVQVEFNPAKVQAYRLIGYENRLLSSEDFNDDSKDAGEINVGHSVTALYEVVPPGVKLEMVTPDPLKYQLPSRPMNGGSQDLLTVKLRYKAPDGFFSRLIEHPVKESDACKELSPDGRWAAAVAAFGMVLRDSPYKGTSTLDLVQHLAKDALGADPLGYRAEFLRIVGMARQAELKSEVPH